MLGIQLFACMWISYTTTVFTNFYSAAGVKGDTGFDEDIIDYMWTKYKIYMPFRQRAPART